MDALEIKEINGLEQLLAGKVSTTDPRLNDPRTPTAHIHDDRYYTEAEVDQQLAGKVSTTDPRLSDSRTPLAHTHLSTQIVDLIEVVQDTVAQMLRGVNVTYNYDDDAGTLTITTAPQQPFDPEAVRDVLGVALRPYGLITIGVDDAGDTITIGTEATKNATDAELRRRDLHTGTQGMDTIEGLSAALGAKANTATVGAHTTRLTALEQPLQASELVAGKEAYIGLSPRQALLKLINEGVAASPTDPTPPTTGNSYVEDDYVEDDYVE